MTRDPRPLFALAASLLIACAPAAGGSDRRPPFVIADDGSIRIEWRDRWDMTIFDELR